MKTLLSTLILTFSTTTFVQAQGQNTTPILKQIQTIDESVYLHCNTTTFVSGESLFFKVYSLNTITKTASPISKFGYVELLDENNKSVIKQKISLEKGFGMGDFFIPTSLKTGNYQLVCYTKWSLNTAEEGIHKISLFIINPFETNTKAVSTTESNGVSANTTAPQNFPVETSNPSFTITTDKEKYASREKVSLKIETPANNIKGNFSVSVRKMDNLPMTIPAKSTDFAAAHFGKALPNLKAAMYLPELRGELIHGKITALKQGSSVADKSVALSIPGKSFDFKISKTNPDGSFYFLLDKLPLSTKATVQVMGDDRNDYGIELDQTQIPELKNIKNPGALTINSSMKEAIEKRSIANQIENNYYMSKADSLIATPKKSPFYYPATKDYILDDYTRFPTLKETITEVVTEMIYNRKDGKYVINVKDYNTKLESYGLPLVLIDGLLVQDTDELFSYDTQNIFKVTLLNQNYIYGPNSFNGLVNLVTKNFDYATKAKGSFITQLELQRPLQKKKYYRPNYGADSTSKIPDFRHQLLWEPEISITEKSTMVDFYTSDINGTFQISLEGFTDQGEAVSIKQYITVQ